MGAAGQQRGRRAMKIGLGGAACGGKKRPGAFRELGGGLSIRLPRAAGAVRLGSQDAELPPPAVERKP